MFLSRTRYGHMQHFSSSGPVSRRPSHLPEKPDTCMFFLAAGRSTAPRAETATGSARGLGNAPVPYHICVSPRLIMRFRAATPMWTKAT